MHSMASAVEGILHFCDELHLAQICLGEEEL